MYAETALSLFLSGSLAFAVVAVNLRQGIPVNLFNYLFGSILTVDTIDLGIIVGLGALILVGIYGFYKELMFMAFDEDCAQVSGIPTKALNNIFMMLVATTIAVSIPIVGVLLISALLIIPVVTALLFRQGFLVTIIIAEFCSILAMAFGLMLSFVFNISPGGMIVLTALGFYIISMAIHSVYFNMHHV
jgi:zinc transport system permease protein